MSLCQAHLSRHAVPNVSKRDETFAVHSVYFVLGRGLQYLLSTLYCLSYERNPSFEKTESITVFKRKCIAGVGRHKISVRFAARTSVRGAK